MLIAYIELTIKCNSGWVLMALIQFDMEYKNACRICLKNIESKFIPIGSYTQWDRLDGPSTGEIRILTMLVEITGDVFVSNFMPNSDFSIVVQYLHVSFFLEGSFHVT